MTAWDAAFNRAGAAPRLASLASQEAPVALWPAEAGLTRRLLTLLTRPPMRGKP